MTPTKMPDFYVQDEGTIFLLHPLTEDATFWIENNLPADAQRWGDTVVIEHRYVADIIVGIERDGLVVVRAK